MKTTLILLGQMMCRRGGGRDIDLAQIRALRPTNSNITLAQYLKLTNAGTVAASKYLEKIRPGKFSIEDLGHAHKLILGGVYDWAGSFRTDPIGDLYTSTPFPGADVSSIPREATLLMEQYHEMSRNPDVLSIFSAVSFLDVRLNLIRPFEDANNRLAMVAVWSQLKARIDGIRIADIKLARHKTALQACADSGNLTPVINFYLETLGCPALDLPVLSPFTLKPFLDITHRGTVSFLDQSRNTEWRHRIGPPEPPPDFDIASHLSL
jgi:fido (protein-threonine AMPylation protein)